jgi:hypothetical protein
LIARAAELGMKDESEARVLLKEHNVKTFRKLERVVAKTTGAEVPTAKPKVIRSIDRAKANAVIRAAKKVQGKLHGSSVNSPGPRGFRLGAVWLKSIVEGKGPAIAAANLPKLVATAAAKGIPIPSRQLTQKELAEHIAKAL